jgi:hypothetical protein
VTPPALVADLAVAAGDLVDETLGTCAGACMGTCALLAVTLTDAGIHTELVFGSFGEQDHWWLELDGHIVDATRRQFDDGPDLSCADDDTSPYCDEHRYPAAWTPDQAVLEFARMFQMPAVGERHALAILDRLKAAAGELTVA